METALNGDIDSTDPAIRRALFIMADNIEGMIQDVHEEMGRLRKAVYGVGAAIVTTLLTATITTLVG